MQPLHRVLCGETASKKSALFLPAVLETSGDRAKLDLLGAMLGTYFGRYGLHVPLSARRANPCDDFAALSLRDVRLQRSLGEHACSCRAANACFVRANDYSHCCLRPAARLENLHRRYA